MPESKKRTPRTARKKGPKKPPRIDPRAPWKPSWWVLWGFLTVVGEVILTFLTKGQLVKLSSLQIAVIAICTPFIAHLLITAFRNILYIISTR